MWPAKVLQSGIIQRGPFYEYMRCSKQPPYGRDFFYALVFLDTEAPLVYPLAGFRYVCISSLQVRLIERILLPAVYKGDNDNHEECKHRD